MTPARNGLISHSVRRFARANTRSFESDDDALATTVQFYHPLVKYRCLDEENIQVIITIIII
jgi:hypothetical protein